MVVTTADFARALLRGYLVLIMGLALVVVPVVGLVAALLVAPFLAGHEGARRLPESWATFYGLVAGALWAVTLVGAVVLGLDFLAAGGVRLGSLELGLLGPLAGLQVVLFWWGARSLYGLPAARAGLERTLDQRTSTDDLDLSDLGELRRRHGEIVEWGLGAAPTGQVPEPVTQGAMGQSALPETGSSPVSEERPSPASTSAFPAPGRDRWVPVPREASIPTARVWTRSQPQWPLPQTPPPRSGTLPDGSGSLPSAGVPDRSPSESRRRPLFKPRRAGRISRRAQPRSASDTVTETPSPQAAPAPYYPADPGAMMSPASQGQVGIPASPGPHPPYGQPESGPYQPGTGPHIGHAPGSEHYPDMTQKRPSPPSAQPSPSLRNAPRLSPLQELQRLKAQRVSYVQSLAPRSGTIPSPSRSPFPSSTLPSPAASTSSRTPATTRGSGGLSYTPPARSQVAVDDLDIVAPSSTSEAASIPATTRAGRPPVAPSPPDPAPASSPTATAQAKPAARLIGVMDMLGAVARGAITGFSEAASAMTHDEQPEAGNQPPEDGKADVKQRSGSAIDAAAAEVAAKAKQAKKAPPGK